MCTHLLSAERAPKYVERLKSEQEETRKAFEAGKAELSVFITIVEARKSRFSFSPYEISIPELQGTKRFSNVSLSEVSEYFDWSPFFWTWELKGSYPSILENAKYGAQAKELLRDGKQLLMRIIEENRFSLNAVVGVWPAHSDGDDVIVYDPKKSDEEIKRLCFLRQQRERQGLNNLCLADFVAPKSSSSPDYIGAFAVVCNGVEEFSKEFELAGDDYSSIMVKALGDRFAEALAEYIHKEIRIAWGYGRQEKISIEELIREEYRGIRPAPGYPACPDHTEKQKIWELLQVEQQIGLTLTESFAMTPASSVSGFYFAHPEAKYFNVGKIDKDQVEDYAHRKKIPVAEVERWLSPNLGY